MIQAHNIPQTRSTPGVQLDPDAGFASIKGSSFPENASQFYQPVFDWISRYCEQLQNNSQKKLMLDLELVYINSSSSKIIMMLLEILEEAAQKGADVEVIWRYHPENETAFECGAEFKEDIQHLSFTLQPEEEEPLRQF